jgi:hypothetical protein
MYATLRFVLTEPSLLTGLTAGTESKEKITLDGKPYTYIVKK